MIDIKNWAMVMNGTASFPRLMDYAALSDGEADAFADQLASRSLAKLKGAKSGKLAPDILAYEEAHRAWANWRHGIDGALGIRSRCCRRANGKAMVTAIQRWAVEMLSAKIPPGDYLRLVTPMITGSPTFDPTVGFSPAYMFSEALRGRVITEHATRGRNFAPAKAGKSTNNSFVGDLDDRVMAFVSGLDSFDAARWNKDNIHVVVSAAKTLASGRTQFMTKAIRSLAVPLSKQDWLTEV